MKEVHSLHPEMAKGSGHNAEALRVITCAPVSRVLCPPCGEPPSFIWDAPHGTPRSTYPPAWSGPLFHAAPCGTRGPAYLVFQPVGFTVPFRSHGTRWSLTPPFHPCLPTTSTSAVCFLLHFPWPGRHRPGPFPLGSTVPYAARTFLPPFCKGRAMERCAGCQ